MVQVDLLEKFPIFNGMARETLSEIAERCNVYTYRFKEYVFIESDPALKFYILLKGRVAINRRIRRSWLHAQGISEVAIYYLNETDVFGWSAFLRPGGLVTGSAYCLENSEVIEIGGGELRDILDAPQNSYDGYLFTKRLARAIASRCDETSEDLLGQIEEVETYRVM